MHNIFKQPTTNQSIL